MSILQDPDDVSFAETVVAVSSPSFSCRWQDVTMFWPDRYRSTSSILSQVPVRVSLYKVQYKGDLWVSALVMGQCSSLCIPRSWLIVAGELPSVQLWTDAHDFLGAWNRLVAPYLGKPLLRETQNISELLDMLNWLFSTTIKSV